MIPPLFEKRDLAEKGNKIALLALIDGHREHHTLVRPLRRDGIITQSQGFGRGSGWEEGSITRRFCERNWLPASPRQRHTVCTPY